FGRANVAVAGDGNGNSLFNTGNPVPLRLAGVALLAGARMEGQAIEAFGLGHARQLHADDLRIVPSGAKFDRERNRDGFADGAEDFTDSGQVAEQAGAAIAADDALGRATEVEIDQVKAGFFDDARGF